MGLTNACQSARIIIEALFARLQHLHTPIGNSKTITAFNLTHIWNYMHGPESNSANVSQAIEYNYPREYACVELDGFSNPGDYQ